MAYRIAANATPSRQPQWKALALACALASPGSALALDAGALPQQGQVMAGRADIRAGNQRLDIEQHGNKAVIDWQSFSIGREARVNFLQPSSSALVLNRVLGSEASSIQGRLTANGQVFLSNPNGVLFGQGARVDVGGLVATSLQLGTDDFMVGDYRLRQGAGAGPVVNQGELVAADGSYIGLFAPEVMNEGLVSARLGTVAIGAGERIRLEFANDSLVGFAIEEGALRASIHNREALVAEGGQVLLGARAASELAQSVISQEGLIRAGGLSVDAAGRISLTADMVSLGGHVDASGEKGGTVEVAATSLLQSGYIDASGSAGAGGAVTLSADRALQTVSASINADGATTGGRVSVHGHQSVLASGTLSADGGGTGGTIDVLGDDISLAGAQISARGDAGGGEVHVGGDFQGTGERPRARTLWVNDTTTIDAGSGTSGDGGRVILWSDGETRFGGTITARGGSDSGNGGFVEVSGKEALLVGGHVDAGADNGVGGTLLLDPKNITIGSVAAMPSERIVVSLADPSPGSGDEHGTGSIERLSNGNFVYANYEDDFGATNAGAVYVYRGSDGALLSMLVGSHENDRLGWQGITILPDGNFIVSSRDWDNGAAADAGAVTWGSGDTGISGIVSSSNSLVGSTAGDMVGSGGVTVLANGNYVVSSPDWDSGAAIDAGAVTWGDGSMGIRGLVGVGNSLVGSSSDDRVGTQGNFGDVAARQSIYALANGNYVVRSHFWDNGAVVNAGAVTWGNGLAGIAGEINSTNSLVGSTAEDALGNGGITMLASGNYVVRSYLWDNGAATDAGAVTWGDGALGVSGHVSGANSLVGSTTNDLVGYVAIKALQNGNYVVTSPYWNDGSAVAVGAVTWGNGLSGVSGTVGGGNSLVGNSDFDSIGSGGIAELSNGNFVVRSLDWDSGGVADAGAVTWVDGSLGRTGVVSSGNSLVGATAGDKVGLGGITALANGNYVVGSYNWDNGSVVDAGAATWADGSVGGVGVVSVSNSLVGTSADDQIGLEGIFRLANGNYVVSSSWWDNGAAINAGAVTWGDGSVGISGFVSSANSLVGSQSTDRVGIRGIVELANGNYVVRSDAWNNGTVSNAGAATWASGTSGISGVVSAANSLVGGSSDDYVGTKVTALRNGNYVVSSSSWDAGSVQNVGAVTWGNGSTGVVGEVSATNSLVGSSAGDSLGQAVGDVVPLSNGNYVVASPNWDNGGLVNAGAVTWGDGTVGVSGQIDDTNSLVGNAALQSVGDRVFSLVNGNYLVVSETWDGGRGAVTWGDGSVGVTGFVSAGNSLVGSSVGDKIGSRGVRWLANGDYLVISPFWGDGSGAMTWASGEAGLVGTINSENSFVGDMPGDSIGDSLYTYSDGTFLVASPDANGGAGRMDFVRLTNGPADGWAFGAFAGKDVTLSADQIAAITSTGTAVILQANNDLVVDSAIITDNPGGDGGAITLQAGRSLLINADVVTDNGDLTFVANELEANGVHMAFRDGGTASLVVGDGVTLDAGTGNLVLRVANELHAGDESLIVGTNARISGGHVSVLNQAGGGDMTVMAGATLTASGGGDALHVGATGGGDLHNLAGDGAFNAPAGRWLAFSHDPSSTTEGVGIYQKRYDFRFGDDSSSLAGNYFLYDIAPVISVVADSGLSRVYGEENPSFTYVPGGGIDGDSVGFGGALGAAATAASDVGNYDINQGSLVLDAATLALGYRIEYTGSTFAITPRAVAVTADAGQGKVYGDVDPVFSYGITSGSLVSGDTFSGALDRAAGESVGNYAIGQGTLNLGNNYELSFVADEFAITPRAITVAADPGQAKTYGKADPLSLRYSIASGSLAFTDTFSGALDRAAGENVGNYAIGLGTLDLGANYVLGYIGDDFAITPAILKVHADDKVRLQGERNPPLTYTVAGLGNGDTAAVLSGVDMATRAGVDSGPGTYRIAAYGGSTGPNYLLTYIDGTLVVRPVPEMPAVNGVAVAPDPVAEFDQERRRAGFLPRSAASTLFSVQGGVRQ